MNEHQHIPRQRTLTDADMVALAELLQRQHPCRFDNVSREDMDFVKDLLRLYKETRSEVLKWIIRGVVYGVLLVAAIGLYVKMNLK